MAKKARNARKPKGWRAFDALTRKVAAVPKEEVDKLEAKRPKRDSKK